VRRRYLSFQQLEASTSWQQSKNLLEQAYELNDSAELLQTVHRMPCTKHLSEKKKQEQISKCKKAEIVNTEQIVGLIAILGR
jgi:hypothetical protein